MIYELGRTIFSPTLATITRVPRSIRDANENDQFSRSERSWRIISAMLMPPS